MLRFSFWITIDIVKHLKGGEIMTYEELRQKLQKSKEEAHKEVFVKYCNYVYAIVFNRLRSCASREDIEECVCDVFADVYIHYDSEKELEGDISGFIGTVARRKAYAVYRRLSSSSGNISIDDDITESFASDIDIEKESEEKERRNIILDMIGKLGEPDSTIIIQKYYYGRSAKEIAEMAALTPENVRMRSSRAVKKLKELLTKAGVTL